MSSTGGRRSTSSAGVPSTVEDGGVLPTRSSVTSGGCGCSVPTEPSPAWPALVTLATLGAMGARRRRRLTRG
jgi:MYXO-CTERM domain-containing protein